MTKQIFQHYYTATQHGVDGGSGFQCKAFTPQMPEQLRGQLARYINYRVPSQREDSFVPPQPPRSYRYQLLDEGFAFVSNIVYIGEIEGESRAGNFFAHSLLVPLEVIAEHPPIFFHNSSFWKTSCPDELKELPVLSEHELGVSVDREAVLRWLAKPFHQKATLSVLARIVDPQLKNRRCFVLAPPKDIEMLLCAATYYLPPQLRPHLTFATYEHDPRRQFLLTGITNEQQFHLSSQSYQSEIILHFYRERLSDLKHQSPYLQLCERSMASQSYEQMLSLFDFWKRFDSADLLAELDLGTRCYLLFESGRSAHHEYEVLLWAGRNLRKLSDNFSIDFFQKISTAPELLTKTEIADTYLVELESLAASQPSRASVLHKQLLDIMLSCIGHKQENALESLLQKISKSRLDQVREKFQFALQDDRFVQQHSEKLSTAPALFWKMYITIGDPHLSIWKRLFSVLLPASVQAIQAEQMTIAQFPIPQTQSLGDAIALLAQFAGSQAYRDGAIRLYAYWMRELSFEQRVPYRKMLEAVCGEHALCAEIKNDFDEVNRGVKLIEILNFWKPILEKPNETLSLVFDPLLQQASERLSAKERSDVFKWMTQNGLDLLIDFESICRNISIASACEWLATQLSQSTNSRFSILLNRLSDAVQKCDEEHYALLLRLVLCDQTMLQNKPKNYFAMVDRLWNEARSRIYWKVYADQFSEFCTKPEQYVLVAQTIAYWYGQLKSEDRLQEIQAQRFLMCCVGAMQQGGKNKQYNALCLKLFERYQNTPWFHAFEPFFDLKQVEGFFAKMLKPLKNFNK